jgi:hypothetical protein
MRERRAYRRLVCVLLGALTLGLVGAAPANAVYGCSAGLTYTFPAQLSVARNFTIYSVNVSGVIPMTQAQAQALINSGHKVVWRLYGDDPVFDDFLFGPDPAQVGSTPGSIGLSSTTQGLAFKGLRGTPGGTLDEDDSVFDDHDELYAAIRLLTASNGTVRCGKSNVRGGNF